MKRTPKVIGTAIERMSDDDVQLIASVAGVPAAKVRVIVDLAESYRTGNTAVPFPVPVMAESGEPLREKIARTIADAVDAEPLSLEFRATPWEYAAADAVLSLFGVAVSDSQETPK